MAVAARTAQAENTLPGRHATVLQTLRNRAQAHPNRLSTRAQHAACRVAVFATINASWCSWPIVNQDARQVPH
eukprot:2438111-Alexandrium_andersonii.AAC.1